MASILGLTNNTNANQPGWRLGPWYRAFEITVTRSHFYVLVSAFPKHLVRTPVLAVSVKVHSWVELL